MTDEDFDGLARTLDKMTHLQLYTLHKVTQVQAQLLVLQSLVKALQVNQGCDVDELQNTCDELFAKSNRDLLDNLKDWLAKNDMALPPKDDPWWDRPPQR